MEKTEIYIANLQLLGFRKEIQDSSLFFVRKIETYINQDDVSLSVIAGLYKAKEFDVDAVYFRFFDDNRPPLAQIYIYDNINNSCYARRNIILNAWQQVCPYLFSMQSYKFWLSWKNGLSLWQV
ncbi:hypothetical protein EZS27_030690, partial [termite gut metagenome]